MTLASWPSGTVKRCGSGPALRRPSDVCSGGGGGGAFFGILAGFCVAAWADQWFAGAYQGAPAPRARLQPAPWRCGWRPARAASAAAAAPRHSGRGAGRAGRGGAARRAPHAARRRRRPAPPTFCSLCAVAMVLAARDGAGDAFAAPSAPRGALARPKTRVCIALPRLLRADRGAAGVVGWLEQLRMAWRAARGLGPPRRRAIAFFGRPTAPRAPLVCRPPAYRPNPDQGPAQAATRCVTTPTAATRAPRCAALSKLVLHTRPCPKGSPAGAPTAAPEGGQRVRPRGTSICPRGSPAGAPTAAPPGGHRLLLRCTSSHPRGSPAGPPIATAPGGRRSPLVK
jgi:hypothetical protein